MFKDLWCWGQGGKELGSPFAHLLTQTMRNTVTCPSVRLQLEQEETKTNFRLEEFWFCDGRGNKAPCPLLHFGGTFKAINLWVGLYWDQEGL